jgi:hypothetical protein
MYSNATAPAEGSVWAIQGVRPTEIQKLTGQLFHKKRILGSVHEGTKQQHRGRMENGRSTAGREQ